jgi:hypothetical protein
MNEIIVSGGSKIQKKLVNEAVHYYLKDLIPGHSVMILIKLRKDLFKKENLKADCIWEDDRNKPREFNITIDSSMKIHGVLRALAHECVHVKQFVKREMCDTGNCYITKWNGQAYHTNKGNYWELPWEIEAYGREVGLYEMFVTNKRHSKKRWYVKDPDYL